MQNKSNNNSEVKSHKDIGKSEVKSDKESKIVQILSGTLNLKTLTCKILHMVHNHTQIHNRGINNYYLTSH